MADNNGTPLPAGAPYNRGEQLKMWLGGEAELPPGAPYNRDEQLTMWLGDDAELPPGAPYNRDEQLTMWLKDHIGGGGNPNHIETITGTLANPWGDVDPAELNLALDEDEVSCKMTVDASAIGGNIFTMVGYSNGSIIGFGAIAIMSDYADHWLAFGAEYDGTVDGTLQSCYVLSNGVSTPLDSYASQITTTLTLIHHPLPDTTP